MRHVVLCGCFLVAAAVAVTAQDEGPAVTRVRTPVFLRPDTTLTPLATLEPSEKITIVNDVGAWSRIEFRDPALGKRIGYVESKNIETNARSEQPRAATESAPAAAPPKPEPPKPTPPTAAPAAPRLGSVRNIYIDGYATELMGPEKQIATCFMTKMREQGPFTFPESRDGADAVLTFESSIPKGSTRVIWGRSPNVKARLVSVTGALLWQGENKYKKSTTVWGSSTDIPCGLANGLVTKVVKAIQATQ